MKKWVMKMMIMGNKLLLKNVLICVFAFLIMLLPRRLYFLGAFSYRIVILFALCFCLLLQKGKLSVSHKIVNLPMVLYFVITGIISFTYMQFSTGIGYLIDTALVLVLMYNLLQTKEEFELFINVFLVFLTLYAILGIFECLTGFNIWDLTASSGFQRYRYGLYRSYGSSTNFTNNAAFLMLCLPLVGWKLQQEEVHKWKYAVLYGLVLLNVLATLTRSIILCTILLQLLWLVKMGLLKFIKKHFIPILIAASAVVLILHIPAVSAYADQFLAMFIALYDEETASEITASFGSNANGTGQRMLLYSWIYEAVKDKLFFGLGPNHLFEYAWVTKTGKRMIKNSIENQYLVHLYRYGITGLISYLLMIVSILLGLWKNREYNLGGRGRRLTFGFMAGTAAFIYFISGLSFAASDDLRMLFLILSIFLIHRNRFEKAEPGE